MKELSTEEKAKRYDEAIKYANYLINERCKEGTSGSFNRADLQKMFPQLEEFEDERIRKELISYIKQINYNNSHTWNGINLNVFIVWLEKQGKKIEPIEGFNTEFERQVSHLITSSINKDYEYTAAYVKWVADALLNYAKQEIKKQAEQKPADKIEPKFKVGDWVVNTITNAIEQIIELTEHEYICSGHLIVYFNDQHLLKRWTIEDADNGDILVCGERKRPFIFKGLIDKFHSESPVAYCGIDTLDNFIIAMGKSWWTDEEVYPATKEQRDILFQKMEEAGWEWDAYKKELKLIDPFN